MNHIWVHTYKLMGEARRLFWVGINGFPRIRFHDLRHDHRPACRQTAELQGLVMPPQGQEFLFTKHPRCLLNFRVDANSSGSLAMFAAILRASSFVSSLAAERRLGQ